MILPFALIILLFSIGIGIGFDDNIISNFKKIGFNCLVIALLAIFFSVLLTYLFEKSVLLLKEIEFSLAEEELDNKESSNESKLIVFIMPVSFIIGIACGYFFSNSIDININDYVFKGSLIALYISVGILQGSNIKIFNYVKLLGFKILWISIAIIIGNIIAGVILIIIVSILLPIIDIFV